MSLPYSVHEYARILDELNQLPSETLLEREQEQALGRIIRDCDTQEPFQAQLRKQAIEIFMMHNVRLVASIVTQMATKWPSAHMTDDLMQEGTMGLMKAISVYDPDRPTKFSTMATYWIRQAVTSYVTTASETIRVPAHVNRKKERHTQEVTQAARRARSMRSLDAPLDEGSDLTLVDLIEDIGQEVGRSIDLEDIKEQATALISVWLNPLEAEVIRLRFGLGDDPPLSLTTCAQLLGISDVEVAQLEQSAFTKLRSVAQRDIR